MKISVLAGLIHLCLCGACSILLGATEPGHNPLNADEGSLYQYLRECVDSHQSVPTMEEMERLSGRVLGHTVRARLSARLYHEYGIIGALLTDEEYRMVEYIFRQQGNLGRTHELALRIRSSLGDDTTILRILEALSFLRDAGYVDMRHDDQDVYLVIPRGQTTLRPASRMESHAAERSVRTSPYDRDERPHHSPAVAATDTAAVTALPQPVPLAQPAACPASGVPTRETGPAHIRSQEQTSQKQQPFRRDHPSASGATAPVHTCAPSPSTERAGRHGASVPDTRRRGRHPRPSAAPDEQDWPFLFGQSTYDLRVITSDTYEDVFLSVTDGRLASCLPPVIVFNGGEPDHIYFFRTMENLGLWRADHPHLKGKVMTVPETLSWASNRR